MYLRLGEGKIPGWHPAEKVLLVFHILEQHLCFGFKHTSFT